jgi:glutaredoxin-related protein
MLGKSKSKLIHVSDFIKIEGYIAIPDLSLNAQKIIYLRARGDL